MLHGPHHTRGEGLIHGNLSLRPIVHGSVSRKWPSKNWERLPRDLGMHLAFGHPHGRRAIWKEMLDSLHLLLHLQVLAAGLGGHDHSGFRLTSVDMDEFLSLHSA